MREIKFTLWQGIVFGTAMLALAFFWGAYLGQATFEPQVTVKIVDRVVYEPVEVERIVEVERVIAKEPRVIVITETIYEVVERIVEKVVVKEVPVKLEDFDSLEKLREWLGEECTFILFREEGEDLDCDDYALWLQKKAMKEGYLISVEAILPYEYNKLFREMKIDELHAINSVIIGNEFYYMEPQTREIVFRGRLD